MILEAIIDQIDLKKEHINFRVSEHAMSCFYNNSLLLTLHRDFLYVGLDFIGFSISNPKLLDIIIPRLNSLKLDIERNNRYNAFEPKEK